VLGSSLGAQTDLIVVTVTSGRTERQRSGSDDMRIVFGGKKKRNAIAENAPWG
jgi:hypothetical protein